ncbi:MAG: prepilin-type N-terminal cleavage/methylation domain-containing protein [Phycisphaerales bacterium]
MTPRTTTNNRNDGRPGFTLIEMLVVIAIIAILAGIILVAVGRALGTARRTAVAATLGNINQAIAAFESELGYPPPLITPDDPNFTLGIDDYPTAANRFTIPQARFLEELGLSQNAFRSAMARTRYASEFSITVYLMGIGDLYTGQGPAGTSNELSGIEDDGVAGPGMTNPGRDRSWGGARDRTEHTATPGPVIGPYLDPGQFAGALELVEPNAGTGGGGPRGLYRLNDRFDYPIRYYTGWITKAPQGEPDAGQPTGRYLPPELRDLDGWQNFIANPTDAAQGGVEAGALDNDLAAARWALLSAGAEGTQRDPTVPQAVSALNPNRFYIPPYGDAALVSDTKTMFEMFPLSTAQSQIDQFENAFEIDALRRGIETNVRELGR